MFNIIALALFIEAVVSALKPIWTKGEGMSLSEIVPICIGVVLAVALKIDLLSYVSSYTMFDTPPWAYYIFYIMSGVAIGRGPSFVYDLWMGIKKWGDMQGGIQIEAEEAEVEKDGE